MTSNHYCSILRYYVPFFDAQLSDLVLSNLLLVISSIYNNVIGIILYAITKLNLLST